MAQALPWQALPAVDMQALGAAVGKPFRAVSGVVGSDGAWRYLRADYGAGWAEFIKVIPAIGQAGERAVFATCHALQADDHVRVPVPLWSLPYGDQVLFSYAWVPGRHPSLKDTDFERLGADIARLHWAFKAHLDGEAIRRATKQRLTDLAGVVLDGRFQAFWREHSDFARIVQMKDAYLGFSKEMLEKGRVIHGDLNAGNILCDRGQFSFIDLEDVGHSFLSAGLDLAKIAERLLIPAIDRRDGIDAAGARACWQALLSGYGCVIGADENLKGLDYQQMLLWQMGLAVMILTRSELPASVVQAEIAKFLYLADKTEACAALFVP